MRERRGPSVRVKLTISYAAFLALAGVMLLAIAFFLLRYVPDANIVVVNPDGNTAFAPNRGDLTRAFTPIAVTVMVFLMVVGIGGGWFLAGYMLRPLKMISDAAQLAADGSLTHRLRFTGADDEFHLLADTFDMMLERIERDMTKQRRFAANASHELRTPIAISQAIIDVARRDPDRNIDTILDQLGDANTRAADLIQTLLLLSRIEALPVDDYIVDLSLVAEEAAEGLLPLAGSLHLELDTQPAPTRGSATLLRQLVTNLVHNAIVHNIPDGSIKLSTSSAAGNTQLRVENTGTPINPDTIRTLTEPFERGHRHGHRNDGAHAGIGLGLAIAQSIVDAHHAELTLVPRADGGLISIVQLPSATSPAP